MIRSLRVPVFLFFAACLAVVLGSHVASTAWLQQSLPDSALRRVLPVTWLRLAVEILILAGGWAVLWWLVLRDRQDRLERSRLDHLEEVALFSGGFAHEARNYIHAMQTRLELLRKSVEGNERAVERVQKLEEVTAGMEQLLADFLSFARPAESKLEQTDLPALVRQVLDFEALELERSGIDVVLHADADLPHALVDRGKLKRALLNLVVNARQAMPAGGRIEVRLTRRRGGVRIEVEDTGSGIPLEDQPRIFQTYFSTKSQGTGLGLAIVKRTIEDVGGTISFRSEPGRGTTFTVDLPAAARYQAQIRRVAREMALRKAAG